MAWQVASMAVAVVETGRTKAKVNCSSSFSVCQGLAARCGGATAGLEEGGSGESREEGGEQCGRLSTRCCPQRALGSQALTCPPGGRESLSGAAINPLNFLFKMIV